MYRRINITLPDETIELIAQVVGKGDSQEETLGDRSRFINEAGQYYIAHKALVYLRGCLKSRWSQLAIAPIFPIYSSHITISRIPQNIKFGSTIKRAAISGYKACR